ncbi:MAG: hypothetical protein V4611_04800 [Patescibacteria group bacterium]
MPKTTIQPVKKSSTTWGQIAFWSLIPAIVLVPLWLTLGRTVFGVGGWYILIFMFSLAPLAFIYHVTVEILAWFGPKKRSLTSNAAYILGTYYGAVLLFGLSIVDFGDTSGSEASVLTAIGIPLIVSHLISAASGLIMLVAAILLLVVLIRDISTARKAKVTTVK